MTSVVRDRQTILLVSDDAALCSSARRDLEALGNDLRVSAVNSVDAAEQIMRDAAPAVILLEEASLKTVTSGLSDKGLVLKDVIRSLAVHAPVVVIGTRANQPDLAALVAEGLANFVAPSPACLTVAIKIVEERLREHRRMTRSRAQSNDGELQKRVADLTAGTDKTMEEDFGEVLRHELNNPLTGILGNAELLLGEVLRKNDGKLPSGAQQRLETIMTLAVRLRETVCVLSKKWEDHHNLVR